MNNDSFYIKAVQHFDTLNGHSYFRTKTTSMVICKLCENVVRVIETKEGHPLPVIGDGELEEIGCETCKHNQEINK